jgi:3-methyladenine DNA glycosylase/8-oxoguanine DNA glycosylase
MTAVPTTPGAPPQRVVTAPAQPGARLRWEPPYPLDIRATLGVLQRGAGDPTQRLAPAEAWRTARTPDGPATLRLVATGGVVEATAWGSGAGWLLAAVPDLLGIRDRPEDFPPVPGPLADASRRKRAMRLPRVGLVYEMLVPSVLEQLVTGAEARRSWRELLWRFGEPAPGPAPAGMRVVPTPATLVRLPPWEWHRAGVDGRRRETLIAVARVAPALDRLAGLPLAEAKARLLSVPGVGAWTVGEVAARAFGDADAVPVGDFHLPAVVGHALTGRALDDAGMLAALEPYRPQRYRAIRLIETGGFGRPRFGPRYPVRDNRRS